MPDLGIIERQISNKLYGTVQITSTSIRYWDHLAKKLMLFKWYT